MMPQPLPKILIVDNDKDFCASLFDRFEDRGFEVDASIDAVTALYLNQLREYDIAVVDLNLPTMNGLTLFRRMRNSAHNLRGLLLSRTFAPEAEAAARQAGFDGAFTKPVDFLQFEQLILEVWAQTSCPEATAELLHSDTASHP